LKEIFINIFKIKISKKIEQIKNQKTLPQQIKSESRQMVPYKNQKVFKKEAQDHHETAREGARKIGRKEKYRRRRGLVNKENSF